MLPPFSTAPNVPVTTTTLSAPQTLSAQATSQFQLLPRPVSESAAIQSHAIAPVSADIASHVLTEPATKPDDRTMSHHTIHGTLPVDVSANNPCPFLRMLVANGELPDGEVSIERVNAVIQKIVAVQDLPSQPVPAAAIKAVAATANGLGPLQVAHNIRHGVTLNNLRYHIFDKRGSGTRILDQNANFVPSEMARLTTFGSPKMDSDGNTEIGLNAAEIQTMLDANYARAKGHRRRIDRRIMNGELPIALRVIGKQGKNMQGNPERYLSVADLELLFKERRLPNRLLARLAAQNES